MRKHVSPEQDRIPDGGDHPILEILDDVSHDELARLATDIVQAHQRHLDRAQRLFEQLEEQEAACEPGNSLTDLRHEYRLALLQLKNHHELVRTVVDLLGHVPDSRDEALGLTCPRQIGPFRAGIFQL
ncbi:MAG: hypothetical protein H6881_08425 [Rhodobiaceae bacterium]|nr:hypothetical protein [Rhodobiaceae bacterium]MCC0051888.1 hypothetical protein [Rhodobiaceae bacterium]